MLEELTVVYCCYGNKERLYETLLVFGYLVLCPMLTIENENK